MSDAAAEISWICNILKELGIPQYQPPESYCDNLSAVYLTANPAFHKKSKHFANHYHYVREKVALKTVIVRHIPGHDQIADIFTKSLPVGLFTSLRYKLGVVLPPTQSLRGSISRVASTTVPISAPISSGKNTTQLSQIQSHIHKSKTENEGVEEIPTTEVTETMGCTLPRSSNSPALQKPKFNNADMPNISSSVVRPNMQKKSSSSQRLTTPAQRDEIRDNKVKAMKDCTDRIPLSNRFECLDTYNV
ncbi:PREDICTED: uncharacterized protein LOC104743506 [Camelina sativa]|uniref:Uncharacterized protein LOC104743506 n=1 Tax=Camelina sativa TaxID=90675 RepID=A0ABM1QWA5_CAMSA|nr:PREDICTED: uncharacterized protein LOC104743506 [Camelina sativa]